MAIDISNIKSKRQSKSEVESDPSKKSFMDRDISLFGNKLGDKKKERFYSQLSILLEAGVDIRSSLELVIDEQKNEKDRELFQTIMDEVIAGDTLSESVRRSGKFSDQEYYNIQIGEETGKLYHILNELSIYYQKKIKQKRQFTTALSYPILVLTGAMGAIIFMFVFIVPMFEDVFNRFGGKLPAITQMIVDISDALSNNIGLFFLMILSVSILISFNRKKEWFRSVSSKMALKIPVFGGLMRMIYLARFCQSMQLMISSKIPLLKAVNLSQKMIGFYPIEQALLVVEKDLLQGESLFMSMRKFSIFDKRLTSLIKVGEEVNQLDSFFDKIAKQYSEESEHQTKLMSSLMDPILMIFLGTIIGVILIAMYLPLFQMSNSFGG